MIHPTRPPGSESVARDRTFCPPLLVPDGLDETGVVAAVDAEVRLLGIGATADGGMARAWTFPGDLLMRLALGLIVRSGFARPGFQARYVVAARGSRTVRLYHANDEYGMVRDMPRGPGGTILVHALGATCALVVAAPPVDDRPVRAALEPLVERHGTAVALPHVLDALAPWAPTTADVQTVDVGARAAAVLPTLPDKAAGGPVPGPHGEAALGDHWIARRAVPVALSIAGGRFVARPYHAPALAEGVGATVPDALAAVAAALGRAATASPVGVADDPDPTHLGHWVAPDDERRRRLDAERTRLNPDPPGTIAGVTVPAIAAIRCYGAEFDEWYTLGMELTWTTPLDAVDAAAVTSWRTEYPHRWDAFEKTVYDRIEAHDDYRRFMATNPTVVCQEYEDGPLRRVRLPGLRYRWWETILTVAVEGGRLECTDRD
jgi:hypothetical protein